MIAMWMSKSWKLREESKKNERSMWKVNWGGYMISKTGLICRQVKLSSLSTIGLKELYLQSNIKFGASKLSRTVIRKLSRWVEIKTQLRGSTKNQTIWSIGSMSIMKEWMDKKMMISILKCTWMVVKEETLMCQWRRQFDLITLVWKTTLKTEDSQWEARRMEECHGEVNQAATFSIEPQSPWTGLWDQRLWQDRQTRKYSIERKMMSSNGCLWKLRVCSIKTKCRRQRRLYITWRHVDMSTLIYHT